MGGLGGGGTATRPVRRVCAAAARRPRARAGDVTRDEGALKPQARGVLDAPHRYGWEEAAASGPLPRCEKLTSPRRPPPYPPPPPHSRRMSRPSPCPRRRKAEGGSLAAGWWGVGGARPRRVRPLGRDTAAGPLLHSVTLPAHPGRVLAHSACDCPPQGLVSQRRGHDRAESAGCALSDCKRADRPMGGAKTTPPPPETGLRGGASEPLGSGPRTSSVVCPRGQRRQGAHGMYCTSYTAARLSRNGHCAKSEK